MAKDQRKHEDTVWCLGFAPRNETELCFFRFWGHSQRVGWCKCRKKRRKENISNCDFRTQRQVSHAAQKFWRSCVLLSLRPDRRIVSIPCFHLQMLVCDLGFSGTKTSRFCTLHAQTSGQARHNSKIMRPQAPHSIVGNKDTPKNANPETQQKYATQA